MNNRYNRQEDKIGKKERNRKVKKLSKVKSHFELLSNNISYNDDVQHAQN